MTPQFEIVTNDGKTHGPFSASERHHAIASSPTIEKAAEDEAPGRGVRVIGCEPMVTPHD